jgi:hypothetical protein
VERTLLSAAFAVDFAVAFRFCPLLLLLILQLPPDFVSAFDFPFLEAGGQQCPPHTIPALDNPRTLS